jgi:hypothetical protein
MWGPTVARIKWGPPEGTHIQWCAYLIAVSCITFHRFPASIHLKTCRWRKYFFSVYRVKVRSAPSPYQSEHRIFMFQSLYLVSTNFCVYVHQMIKERTVRRCQAVGECCRLDGLDLVKTLLEATDIKRK